MERGEAWTLDKARRIVSGWPFDLGDVATGDLTLSVDADTVTVRRHGMEIAAFHLRLMTWSDGEIEQWQRSKLLPSLSDLRNAGD